MKKSRYFNGIFYTGTSAGARTQTGAVGGRYGIQFHHGRKIKCPFLCEKGHFLLNCSFYHATAYALFAVIEHRVLTFCYGSLLLIKGDNYAILRAVFPNDFNGTTLFRLAVTEFCRAMEFPLLWRKRYPVTRIHYKPG